MIEQDLKPGTRLTWRVPGAKAAYTRDGTIHDDPGGGVPPIIAERQAGGGAGGLWIGSNVKRTLSFDWLCYGLGVTLRRRHAGDVLTGPMSGCLIARWTDNTGTWVGHCGTVESSADVNASVKSMFANYMPASVTGFFPAAAIPDSALISASQNAPLINGNRPDGSKVVALVTASGQFYAILLLTYGMTDQVVVGALEQVPPLNNAAIRAKWGIPMAPPAPPVATPWKSAQPIRPTGAPAPAWSPATPSRPGRPGGGFLR